MKSQPENSQKENLRIIFTKLQMNKIKLCIKESHSIINQVSKIHTQSYFYQI